MSTVYLANVTGTATGSYGVTTNAGVKVFFKNGVDATEIRFTRDGLRLLFLSTDRHEDFLETDDYFLFLHTDAGGDDGIWHMFEVIDIDTDAEIDFDHIIARRGEHHKWVVFHRQEIAWSNVDNIGSNKTVCPKCKSKKIEYVGLGVGSSQTELICPKCG